MMNSLSKRDENEKRKKHRVDDCRRVHDYDEFIQTFLAMLAERGHLGDLLEHSLNLTRYVLTSFFVELYWRIASKSQVIF
jgi:hypothetical protein